LSYVSMQCPWGHTTVCASIVDSCSSLSQEVREERGHDLEDKGDGEMGLGFLGG
jgi:hypothetical protein